MFYTYILKSLKNGKRYVGQISKDVFIRSHEHNVGSNKWTRANKPFVIAYCEKYNTRTEAIKREHFLKSGQGRKWLDNLEPKAPA
jgi:putative endonuclease